MQTILGEALLAMKNTILCISLASGILFSSTVISGTGNGWGNSSAVSQAEALSFVEKIAHSRSAGVHVVAVDLGVDVSNETMMNKSGRYPGKNRSFGGITVETSMGAAGGEDPDVVIKFSGGCVGRDFAKEKLLLRDVVWSSPADDPAPVMGYAYFTGGSAVTLFFDAMGSHCLTAARIEKEENLRSKLRNRDAAK